jgi:hypothetical protein
VSLSFGEHSDSEWRKLAADVLREEADGHWVGGRVSRIARVSQALSSFFEAVFPGKCSRRNSGAGRG